MTTNRPPSCDLKPCPFCEHELIERTSGMGNGDENYWAVCPECGFESPWSKDLTTVRGMVNHLPRRSEVLELLRSVDEVTQWRDDVELNELVTKMDSRLSDSLAELSAYSEKLRKEIGE